MTKKKIIYTRILSSCIVLSMILTGFAAFFTSNPSQMTAIAEENPTNTPSLRVYGEHNAVYPTQSYYGANDFIYPEEYDPFDPGIIEKDSITFNPAFWHGHDDYEIKAMGDASEKIFLRTFYEPGYTHPVDAKMNAASDVILQPVEEFDSIVTETTYFLTSLDHTEPQSGDPGSTHFVFPYESTNNNLPGMEHADLIEVNNTNNMETMQHTDGAIQVEKTFTFQNSNYVGETLSFLDHKICIQNFEDNDPTSDKLDIDIFYIGNMHEEISSMDSYTIEDTSYGKEQYFDRLNNKQMTSDPAYRWYLRVENADDDYLRIVLGRWLAAGETFYVDGVRYDMPAIYVDQDGKFKYITLQSPIPKTDPITDDTIWHTSLDDNVNDWSHVTSQYLASLPAGNCVWMLPPFNADHKMIDDIGLQPLDCTPDDEEVPVEGLLIDGERNPLCFSYIEQDTEHRFDTSLTERLNTTETGEEGWEWYNVYTKPNHYTTFILPNQEKITDTYENGDDVDGNEYLITSSLIAPNSLADTDRTDICKEYDEHEIYDRVNEIARFNEREKVYQMPRLAYEFDAVYGTDLYINHHSPNPSVRIYGEEDFNYPTHSYYGPNDFVYPIESDPFDPGVIDKDSITFNPAFWHGHGEYEIQAQGDASEKIFLRTFYEPGYTHPVDAKMNAASEVILQPVEEFDSIVTETTYFLTSLDHMQPQAGYPDSTYLALPYLSTDDMHPGMEHADLVKVKDTWNQNTQTLTDGAVKIEKEFVFTDINYTTDIPIEFMDHKVVIKNFEDTEPMDKLDLEVSYLGNMHEAASSPNTYTIWEDSWSPIPSFEYYYDRDNQQQTTPDPAYRWYLRIENADDDYLRISLGRWLFAGETFYVDGVRYDMPAVYVADDGAFKYITLQSPLPKGETIWHPTLDDNVNDWSHVTSQYLASLPENDCVWMLPPFNTDHKMIDDIGLQKYGSGCLQVPLAGKLINEYQEALCFSYVDETVEERFDTSLAERLKTGENDIENWEWYNVFTKPNYYTEFMLPDQEDPMTDTYETGGAVDGNEYLITSSFIAPNSELDTDRRDTCKAYDEHEIFGNIPNTDLTLRPRFTFEFDANDGTGVFINEQGFQLLPPTAIVNAISNGQVETEIQFNGCDSHDNDESESFITQYDWNFGDGTGWHNNIGCMQTHIFQTVGTYTVTLRVTDDEGDTDTEEHIININNGNDLSPTAVLNCPTQGQTNKNIQFNGCDSHDNDESESFITQYDWNFGDGTGWHNNIGCMQTHSFPTEGTYTVSLRVTDDEGDTDTTTTDIDINNNCSATIIIDDVIIPEGGNETTYLRAENVSTPVGSGEWTITYDPDVVAVNTVDFSDFETMDYYDNGAGMLNITAWNTGINLTGDFKIARINFSAVGTSGDSCPLAITDSDLFDDTPQGEEICNTQVDATAWIGCSEPPINGDMNHDSNVNSGDVRYLAMYLAGDPDYFPLHDDGDVNSDGKINSGDIRYLALYLAGDPDYKPLYPSS